MKDNFDDFKEIWDCGPLIVLDTNVLLRLYSFTPEAIAQALVILRSTNNKIWLPDQVVKEFYDNHEKERKRNFNKYTVFLKSIRSNIEKSKNSIEGDFIKHVELKYPLIDEFGRQITELIKEMQSVTEKYEIDIKNEIEKNAKALSEDDIKNFIDELKKSGATGECFTLAELISLFQEGEIRYKYLIPPGYEDIVKDKDDETNQRKYGDLILWKQTLQKAVTEGKDVILVTNDVKEDWWILEKDKPICARKELTKEFGEVVGNKFFITTGANFISYVSKINHIDNTMAYLEMISDEICEKLFESEDWSLILDGDGELTSYLIHSGDLQPFIDDPISDVEITDLPAIFDVDFAVEAVDYHQEKAFIQGSFITKVEVSISSTTFAGDEYPTNDGLCEITGNFSIEFELEHDNEEEPYKEGTVKITVGGFEIEDYNELRYPMNDMLDNCVHCKSRAVYFTSSGDGVCENHIDLYDHCTDCGTLFDKGVMNGAKCNDCEFAD